MGAEVSIVSDKTRTSLPHLHKLPLQPLQVKLRTYTGQSIQVLGEISVDITCQGSKHTLPLLLVKEDGPSLIGRNWLTQIRLEPMVAAYLDNILVAGRTEQKHLKNLTQVLEWLNSAGMKLKKEKCAFCLPQVEYLGHVISEEGLRPSSSKIKAMMDAPEPLTLSELKSFLSLTNYYAKFLPNSPLYKLLTYSEPWQWNTEQVSFENIKTMC